MTRLGDLLVDIKPGFASRDNLDAGVFQFRMHNFTRDSALDLSKRRRVNASPRQLETQAVAPGDVLFNATNSPELVGKSALIEHLDEPAVFSNHFLRLRTDPDKLLPGYLAHFLRWQFARGVFRAMAKAWVNQATVDRNRLASLEVPLPPPPEQRRIAAILDHADALRAKRRHVLAYLDALSPSIFMEMFGKGHYPAQRLDELVDSDDRLNYGVVQPGDETPGGVPLIRVSDLAGGIVDRTKLKHISPEVEAAYARSRLRGNEILVSSVGSIGAVSVVRPPDVGSNIARAITRVPISDEVLRTYVAAYLRTPTPQRYFVAELRTVAQPTLNVGQLAATLIPLPPVDMQRAFGDRLRLVQDDTEAVLGNCDAHDELFVCLQSRAFRGEL